MQIEFIPTDRISPNPRQPRESFEKEKLQELADSITEHDLLHPIIVQKKGKNYQILAGERRWRAYDFAGIKKIPAVVKDVSELEGREIGIIENWHRLRLEPLESEKYLAELYEDGRKAGRYTSILDMARKTGIPDGTLNTILISHKERIAQNLSSMSSTQDIERTKRLRDTPEDRKQVLDLRAKDKIIATDLPKYSEVVEKSTDPVKKALLKAEPTITPEIAEDVLTVEREEEQEAIIRKIETEGLTPEKTKKLIKIMRNAPEPVKKAILRGEIEMERAKPLIAVGITEDKAEDLVIELKREKEEEEDWRTIERDRDIAVLKGDLNAKGIVVQKSVDEKRFEKFRQLHDQIRFLTPAFFLQIKHKKFRKQAIEYLAQMEEYCHNLRIALQEKM